MTKQEVEKRINEMGTDGVSDYARKLLVESGEFETMINDVATTSKCIAAKGKEKMRFVFFIRGNGNLSVDIYTRTTDWIYPKVIVEM